MIRGLKDAGGVEDGDELEIKMGRDALQLLLLIVLHCFVE